MLFVMILELIPVTTHLVRNLSLSIYRMADEQLCKRYAGNHTSLVHSTLTPPTLKLCLDNPLGPWFSAFATFILSMSVLLE